MKKHLICFIFLVTGLSFVSSATFHIPDDYNTIQAAINAADIGDIIKVSAGTYDENIVINKSINLVANNHTKPKIAPSSGTALTIDNVDFVNVTGFEIVTDNWEDISLYINRGSSNNIIDNNISAYYLAIYLSAKSPQSDTTYNTFSQNTITSTAYDAICMYKCRYNNFIANKVAAGLTGFSIHHSSKNTFTENIVSSGSYGLDLSHSKRNIFTENNITSRSWYGVFIYKSSFNTFTGNFIYANLDYGVQLKNSSNNYFTWNTIVSPETGVNLQSNSNNNSFIENDIIAETDIYEDEYSHDNTFPDHTENSDDSNDKIFLGIFSLTIALGLIMGIAGIIVSKKR